MIYWFTGQPGAGKTVLADRLLKYLEFYGSGESGIDIFRLDGDNLRELYTYKDYSIKGRVQNVDVAQKIAYFLHNLDKIVIVSLVSPYLDQREEFKKQVGDDLIEIYVHTSEKRPRESYKVEGYQKPCKNFIDLDTTGLGVEESFVYLLEDLRER